MVVRCLDFMPDGWRRDATILRLMAVRRINIAPDGGTMTQCCTQCWWRDASISRLMAGGTMLGYCA